MAAPERGIEQIAAGILIEAGAVLASSLDPATVIRQVAKLTVPRLADLCVIDLCDEEGLLTDGVVASRHADVEAGLQALRDRFPLDLQGSHPVARVIRTGNPELLGELRESELHGFADAREHVEFMIASRYRTAIVAPLTARRRTIGAISVLRLGPGDPYTQAEMDLTCELARRAALAIDNARLYSRLRDLQQRLEAMLTGLAEAVTVTDRRRRTVFANRAALELIGGLTLQQLLDAGPEKMMERFDVHDEHGARISIDQLPSRRLLEGETPDPLHIRVMDKASGLERWLIARSSPILAPDSQRPQYAVNVFEDITDLKRAEVAERFLAEASSVLASSLDHARTLRQLAKLAVPALADWCAVDVLDEHGAITTVAVHHADPAKLAIAEELVRRYPNQVDRPYGAAQVIRGGKTIHADVDAESLARYAQDASHRELLNGLGVRSVIIAPMLAGGKVIGAITLSSAESARRLTAAEITLAEELGRRAGIAVENARLFTERTRIANVLQRALLPKTLPEIPGAEVAVLYAAAGELNEVGGDFYDLFEHRDGRWVLVIGDVCGKGPQAAGVTALARHTLRAAAASGQSPRMLLLSVHQALSDQPPGLDMCTMGVVLADLRPPVAHLTIVLGGHPHPLLVDGSGSVRALGRAGTLLGVIDTPRIEQAEFEMNAGETLLLYTDGVTDAGAPTNLLGEAELRRIASATHSLPLKEQLERIHRAAVERVHGDMRDDIALLGLRLSRDARPAPAD